MAAGAADPGSCNARSGQGQELGGCDRVDIAGCFRDFVGRLCERPVDHGQERGRGLAESVHRRPDLDLHRNSRCANVETTHALLRRLASQVALSAPERTASEGSSCRGRDPSPRVLSSRSLAGAHRSRLEGRFSRIVHLSRWRWVESLPLLSAPHQRAAEPPAWNRVMRISSPSARLSAWAVQSHVTHVIEVMWQAYHGDNMFTRKPSQTRPHSSGS